MIRHTRDPLIWRGLGHEADDTPTNFASEVDVQRYEEQQASAGRDAALARNGIPANEPPRLWLPSLGRCLADDEQLDMRPRCYTSQE